MLPGWVLRLKGASWADSGSNPWWNEVWIMTFRAWLQARSPSLYKPKRVQKKIASWVLILEISILCNQAIGLCYVSKMTFCFVYSTYKDLYIQSQPSVSHDGLRSKFTLRTRRIHPPQQHRFHCKLIPRECTQLARYLLCLLCFWFSIFKRLKFENFIDLLLVISRCVSKVCWV
jgi:hypothetical protein